MRHPDYFLLLKNFWLWNNFTPLVRVPQMLQVKDEK